MVNEPNSISNSLHICEKDCQKYSIYLLKYSSTLSAVSVPRDVQVCKSAFRASTTHLLDSGPRLSPNDRLSHQPGDLNKWRIRRRKNGIDKAGRETPHSHLRIDGVESARTNRDGECLSVSMQKQ